MVVDSAPPGYQGSRIQVSKEQFGGFYRLHIPHLGDAAEQTEDDN